MFPLQSRYVFRQTFSRNFSISAGLSRLRSEWRRDRKPANTKLGNEDVLETRKAFGGRSKVKAKMVNKGMYILQSRDIDKELKILDVVHSDAGKHYHEQKIIVKGAIIAVDGSELLSEIDPESLLADEHYNDNIVKEHIENLLQDGKMYAKVTTRPGQVGKCDGYILEGSELASFVRTLKIKERFS